MAGKLRKDWQTFKKDHPDFEKSKSFKSDVGGQLDKFDKLRDEHSQLRDELRKKSSEILTTGKSVAAALKGYEAIVDQLKESDKSILTDFKKLNFESFQSTYVDQYGRTTIDV